MNDWRRGWLGGLTVGIGGTLALVCALLGWIAWEDLR